MTNTLASFLVPIGIAGAVMAVVCALITTFALARGSAGLAGGGAGVWIVGALLSLCASFAMLWTPFLIAVGALVAAFVVGAVLRRLFRGVTLTRTTVPAETQVHAAVQEPATPAAEASPRAGAPRTPARSIPARAITETVRVAS
ncbi:hypothetical protein [Microbacterium esteraromaticum]|uniref:hypothetical protein n=1 Tax=Microbacterium esteraromaticum TaxID=57043 RepID=UPI00195BCD42|nr:hypothetical protein [Microbacterium esteraromaticum]MBM7465991.1 small-conductance mechanosensitive channel [Microbacterium esteraromaticum]